MADRSAGPKPTRFISLVLTLLVASLLLATQSLESPGLYYDEAVQARPAREFITGIAYGTPFPGSRVVSIGGRPFPWMTQPYMGGLKSQALIPSVWLFGPSVYGLRFTTLVWALLGVAWIAAFARRSFGERTALFATLLLAFDPSLLLLARHDWGSFAISLLLRGAVLFSFWRWWQARHTAFLFGGAIALGLGIYNKVDFSVFAFAAGLGVLACGARPLFERLRQEPRSLAIAAFGATLGVLPMLPSIGSVLAARSAFREEGEGVEKLRTLWSMLDGSYFQRLIEQGGLFDHMYEATSWQPGLLGVAFVAAMPAACALLLRAKRAGDDSAWRSGSFLLVASIAALLGYMALPGGVRIHHALNIYPFPQLLVAWVLAGVAGLGKRAHASALVAAGVIAIAGTLAVQHTLAFAAQTGGRGRWSDSLDQFANELKPGDAAVIVSLDWGFHETLGFLTEGPRLIDAYPRIPAALAQRGAWRIDGTSRNLYLLHEAPYDLFGYGAPFLAAVARLDPEKAIVERHLDREGNLAFASVRFGGSHRIVFSPRGFDIRAD